MPVMLPPGSAHEHDDVDFLAHEFGGRLLNLGPGRARSTLEDEVLALDPAQTLQRVDERRPGALLRRIGLLEVCRGQVADPIDLPGLLAVSRERGQQKTL